MVGGQKKGRVKVKVVEQVNMHNDIIALLLDGQSTTRINKYLVDKYGCTKKVAYTRIWEVRDIIRERKNFEVHNMINIHLARYERIYTETMELRMVGIAMQALQSKERLTGLHRDDFHMRISNGQTSEVQVKHIVNEYDLNKLEGDKADRFNFLIDKIEKRRSQLK